MKSGLSRRLVARILELCDMDKDRKFDVHEFCIAFHVALCVARKGAVLPSGNTLPDYLIRHQKSICLDRERVYSIV